MKNFLLSIIYYAETVAFQNHLIEDGTEKKWGIKIQNQRPFLKNTRLNIGLTINKRCQVTMEPHQAIRLSLRTMRSENNILAIDPKNKTVELFPHIGYILSLDNISDSILTTPGLNLVNIFSEEDSIETICWNSKPDFGILETKPNEEEEEETKKRKL